MHHPVSRFSRPAGFIEGARSDAAQPRKGECGLAFLQLPHRILTPKQDIQDPNLAPNEGLPWTPGVRRVAMLGVFDWVCASLGV